ncbi:MAG TPA: nickel pincer cofactor biosynthesis protein LarB [Proteobacteria bacterium]|nr:nickel pincer cofactor biosynthesis protein LarB [Pseudomonadota bacterium]
MSRLEKERLKEILKRVSSGELSVDEAMAELKTLPFEDMGFAHLDHHRAVRLGFPEVVFAQGKTPQQIKQIAKRIVDAGSRLLITRASPEHYRAVKDEIGGAQYHELARAIWHGKPDKNEGKGSILIVAAGTSDMPVAEEARITAEMMANEVKTLYDVGVAGIHRLLDKLELLNEARAIVVVAGMEGALASVVGGLVDKPIIAVPTSVGYGASFRGLSALLAMLNSCAPNVAVVNIDNGFGAAYVASLINRL